MVQVKNLEIKEKENKIVKKYEIREMKEKNKRFVKSSKLRRKLVEN